MKLSNFCQLYLRQSNAVGFMSKKFCNTTPMVETKKNYKEMFTTKSNIHNLVENSDTLISRKIKNDANIDDCEWPSIQNEIAKEYRQKNPDPLIFDICSFYNKENHLTSFFNYLRTNNEKVQLNILLKYLKFFGMKRGEVSEERQAEILLIYDEIHKQYPFLDANSSETCISAVCKTKRWEECFELLEMIKITDSPKAKSLNFVISAAFRYNKPEVGWKMLNEMDEANVIFPSTYYAYLDYCLRNFENETLDTEISKMLKFWDENLIEPSKAVVDKYVSIYEKLGYTATYTLIPRKGECQSCSYKLKPAKFTNSEFHQLSNAVLKNVIIGKNVYCSTSPQELKRYLLFAQTMKSYDVVIDGLNVAYAAKDIGEKQGSIRSVVDVVQLLRAKGKRRVLVVGRAHMNWWSPKDMKTLRELADVFLIKNMSADDPFLIHLSLISGPQTEIVTRDYLRQHKFKLDTHSARLFKLWQITNQSYVLKVRNNTTIYHEKLCFKPYTQKDENGWHIAYNASESLKPPESFHPTQTWVCLRKANKSP